MSTPFTRQPKGVPVGGQFAATTHTESSVTLGAPTVGPDFVGQRLGELGLAAHLNRAQLEEVSAQLNESRDFSDRNIRAVSDDVHLRSHGFTASLARDADRALQTLRDAGHADQADALLLVTEARLAHARQAAQAEVADRPAAPLPWAPPDGKTVPVFANDIRLQAGEVFDKVHIGDTIYTRAEALDYPNDPYSMRFQANRRLSDEEAYALSGVVGYANRAAIGGEPLDDPAVGPKRDTPFSFVVNIDTTKGRQRNYDKFQDMIPDIIANGSPARSSQGGTRAIEAFDDPDLKLEVYYGD